MPTRTTDREAGDFFSRDSDGEAVQAARVELDRAFAAIPVAHAPLVRVSGDVHGTRVRAEPKMRAGRLPTFHLSGGSMPGPSGPIEDPHLAVQLANLADGPPPVGRQMRTRLAQQGRRALVSPRNRAVDRFFDGFPDLPALGHGARQLTDGSAIIQGVAELHRDEARTLLGALEFDARVHAALQGVLGEPIAVSGEAAGRRVLTEDPAVRWRLSEAFGVYSLRENPSATPGARIWPYARVEIACTPEGQNPLVDALRPFADEIDELIARDGPALVAERLNALQDPDDLAWLVAHRPQVALDMMGRDSDRFQFASDELALVQDDLARRVIAAESEERPVVAVNLDATRGGATTVARGLDDGDNGAQPALPVTDPRPGASPAGRQLPADDPGATVRDARATDDGVAEVTDETVAFGDARRLRALRALGMVGDPVDEVAGEGTIEEAGARDTLKNAAGTARLAPRDLDESLGQDPGAGTLSPT